MGLTHNAVKPVFFVANNDANTDWDKMRNGDSFELAGHAVTLVNYMTNGGGTQSVVEGDNSKRVLITGVFCDHIIDTIVCIDSEERVFFVETHLNESITEMFDSVQDLSIS